MDQQIIDAIKTAKKLKEYEANQKREKVKLKNIAKTKTTNQNNYGSRTVAQSNRDQLHTGHLLRDAVSLAKKMHSLDNKSKAHG